MEKTETTRSAESAPQTGREMHPPRRSFGGPKGRPRPRRQSSRPPMRRPQFSRSQDIYPKNDSGPAVVIPSAGENVRIIPLGGVEEIGRNMTAIEYKGDIIVLDAGFQFKDENTPGIDYILPNIKYLEDNKDKIRGMVVSHAHLDLHEKPDGHHDC